VLQHATPNGRVVGFVFCGDMMDPTAKAETVLSKTSFSDEAIFHLSRKVKRVTSGSRNPHAVVEYLRDSPKINIFCALSCDKLSNLAGGSK
jgi:hypothetical protein